MEVPNLLTPDYRIEIEYRSRAPPQSKCQSSRDQPGNLYFYSALIFMGKPILEMNISCGEDHFSEQKYGHQTANGNLVLTWPGTLHI